MWTIKTEKRCLLPKLCHKPFGHREAASSRQYFRKTLLLVKLLKAWATNFSATRSISWVRKSGKRNLFLCFHVTCSSKVVWLVTSLPHMEKAVVRIPAFPCALRRMSACGLLWCDKRVANWLTVALERERISFSKWHRIYPFISKYHSLVSRKTLSS